MEVWRIPWRIDVEMSIGSQSRSLLVELPGCTQTAHDYEEKAIERIVGV
jgi:vacuolar-type H+-ATPase subunit F/Vma7